jgi:UDP-N-acetylmuramoyl-L-alanyl-D-glutamate--2,6-diaminopimelate ligase
MQLADAIRGVKLMAGPTADAVIHGVQYDSRRVQAGDVFVAMQGGATDGNHFIAGAVERGAAAIMTDSREAFTTGSARWPGVAFALIGAEPTAGRRALAQISANKFGHPERRLAVSAVTGTNGKTTTAWLLEQLLRSAGRRCLLAGTIETRLGDEVRVSEHTTPESRDLYALFADGVAAGCTEVVMEMSSHALAQERVWGIAVDVAMFTNLTQDHLDFHGSMEEYAAAKARLFAGVGAQAPRCAVINVDDAFSPLMLEAARSADTDCVWTYSVTDEKNDARQADFVASDLTFAECATSFRFQTPLGTSVVTLPLMGRVNVYNFMAASAAALARGLSLSQTVAAASTLRQVPGRFETVPNELGITVVVDYAHTDDALKNLIALAQDLVKPADGRVITLFGCGGDRDRTKRPKMGHAAGMGSDLVVLTSDNPRSEDPAEISKEAIAGLRETGAKYVVELDRAKAIALAIREAKPGDIVLLAGKGHEKGQTFADRTIDFDDVEVAATVLRGFA